MKLFLERPGFKLATFLSKKLFVISIIISLFLSALFITKYKWNDGHWNEIIGSDGNGYYAYLPAVFIYHDLQYSFFTPVTQKYHPPDGISVYFAPESNGRKINKYYCGTALLLLPFFAVACLLSAILGYDIDGYSLLFECGVSIATLFYSIAALFILRKLFKTFKINDHVITFTLLSLFWGTNLLYYSIHESSMSHVYGFFASSLFLLYTRKFLLTPTRKLFYIACLCLGLCIIIRPTNGLILLFIPLLTDSNATLKNAFNFILKNVFAGIVGILIIIGMVSLQFILYYGQAKKFILWSYSGEGFNFSKPEIINLLFSFRKGLFVYTPLMFIAVIGIVILFFKDKFRFGFTLFAFLIVSYVLSSWWWWSYGGSFGMRAMIEFFPVLGLALALTIQQFKSGYKAIIITLCTVCWYMNIIQSFQCYQGIITPDNMDRQKYTAVFLSLNDNLRWIFNEGACMSDPGSPPDSIAHTNTFDPIRGWYNINNITTKYAHSVSHATYVSDTVKNGITFSRKIRHITTDTTAYIKINFWAYFEKDTPICLTLSFENGGKNYKLVREPVSPKAGLTTWTAFNFRCDIPKLTGEEDYVKIHFEELKKPPVYIDDIQIVVISPAFK